MTDEEFVEELYMKAFTKGFIEEFRLELESLRKKHANLSRTEIAEIAYMETKRRVNE